MLTLAKQLFKASGLDPDGVPAVVRQFPCVLASDLVKLRRRTSFLVLKLGVDLSLCDFLLLLSPTEELFCTHVVGMSLKEYTEAVLSLPAGDNTPAQDVEVGVPSSFFCPLFSPLVPPPLPPPLTLPPPPRCSASTRARSLCRIWRRSRT